MAASKKRRVGPASKQATDSEDSADSELSDAEEISEDEVQVDFEAFPPTDSDFHGIQKLLLQLFLKAHINVSELADLLIKQNYICSVLKQSEPDETEDEDMEDDVCFGVFSVMNLTEKKNLQCIQQICDYLLDHCKKSCTEDQIHQFTDLLNDKQKHVGFIISERFINIPAQISQPLYETLGVDMEAAVQKKRQNKFDYFILISKTYCSKNEVDNTGENFVNAEEELFLEDSILSFDFSVSDQQDTAICEKWNDSDTEYEPKRKVMLFPAEKWNVLLRKINEEFSSA